MSKQISLNGTVFHPTSVKKVPHKIGKLLEAASGKRNWVHRTHKREWEIAWNGVPEATRAAIETIFLLTTTFTFIDLNGTSYTVQCEGDDYSQSTDADHYAFDDDTLRWDVTLRIHEA
jgi:hypothetical protein